MIAVLLHLHSARGKREGVYEHRLVRFSGAWSREAREVVSETAEAIDRARAHLPRGSYPGKPWVCNCHFIGDDAYFMAHWIERAALVLTARTPAELARRMWELAMP